jgi:hypothetical protein
MSTSIEIGAPGIDTEKLMSELEARVARKTEQGAYADARIARAERTEPRSTSRTTRISSASS